MENTMNQGEIIKTQTERVERLIFLEDLRSLPQSPERDMLIKKYENLTRLEAGAAD